MEPVRIGCVKYLNTLPLIEGLRTWRDCELVAAVPSRLIDMLRGGDVDVALASVIDAARAPVTLLPVGMIGCDGPTLTVRLFSRVPIETIATVAADTDSHTSVVLMQVLLWRKFGIRVKISDFDARERMVVGSGRAEAHGPPPSLLRSDTSPARAGEAGSGDWPEAVLLIGDKVVTDAPPREEYPHQLDLGAAWKELTGLPFVYAVWMCRAGEEDSLKVRAAAKMLDRNRRHNATRLDWIVASRAEERHWPPDLAAKYLGTYLKYDVGDAEREAVEKFLRWGAELGLCERVEPRWAGSEMANGK